MMNDKETVIPKLYVLVGLPGSGKSTYAKEYIESQFINRAKVISTDAIRQELTGSEQDQTLNREVFKLFHERIRRYLELGYDVIADATNITIKSRAAILACTKGINCIKIATVFGTDIQSCLQNNFKRKRRVPEDIIYSMCSKFQIPFYEEGFDVIEVKNQNTMITEAIFNGMMEGLIDVMQYFDQCNNHHNQLLLDHCYTVQKNFTTKYDASYHMSASLLHDVGKLFTQTFNDKDDQAHYYGHAEIGAYFLLSNAIIHNETDLRNWLEILFIVNYHMMPFNWNTEKAQRKWRKIFGEDKFNMLLYFNECDQIRS